MRVEEMYVATVPAHSYLANPISSDIPHLEEILALIAELRCSMYDNSLIPVALASLFLCPTFQASAFWEALRKRGLEVKRVQANNRLQREVA